MADIWLKPNETQMNSNFESANSFRICLSKAPIDLKVSIKKRQEELYCFKSKFSHSFYPLGNREPSVDTSLGDLL